MTRKILLGLFILMGVYLFSQAARAAEVPGFICGVDISALHAEMARGRKLASPKVFMFATAAPQTPEEEELRTAFLNARENTNRSLFLYTKAVIRGRITGDCGEGGEFASIVFDALENVRKHNDAAWRVRVYLGLPDIAN